MMSSAKIAYALLFIGVMIFICFVCYRTTEGFQSDSYKQERDFKKQVALLSQTYENRRRIPISDFLPSSGIPEGQQNFVNFYALGCRFPSYIGPTKDGYMDPDVGVRQAVNAGCRVFVLDIDYIDDCNADATPYFPKVVVRDQQGKIMSRLDSEPSICDSPSSSNLKTICEKINFYAFSDSVANRSDPVVIVLYFLRKPPGLYKAKPVLDYYSRVAQCLAPFKDRLLGNEINGGTFYRQKQESVLLINKITDYNNKVLIFSNANTNGFREVDTYSNNEDLDFMVNLRLGYNQTPLGVTEKEASFGVLETVDDYLIIPSDRKDQMVENTKLKWTICLSTDPMKSVSAENYSNVAGTFGVHCIPTILFDTSANQYLFKDPLFSTYSFVPKPEALRYVKPPVVIPAAPSEAMNANGGMLRAPTVS